MIDGVACAILVLDRGERLFFQHGERALLCDVSARYATLHGRSLRRWTDGSRIDDAARAELLTVIATAYQLSYRDEREVL